MFMVLLGLSTSARAQEGSSLTPSQLTAKATVIGVATVTAIETREHPDNRMVYTYYTVMFREAWKGVPAEPSVIMQAGGVLGNRVVGIAGRQYRLEVGETVVLFAHESPMGPYYVPIGMNQGLFQVGGGAQPAVRQLSSPPHPSGPQPLLSDLKREVCTALGIPYRPPALSLGAPPRDPGTTATATVPTEPTPTAPEPPAKVPAIEESDRSWKLVIAAGLIAAAVLFILLSKRNRRSLMS